MAHPRTIKLFGSLPDEIKLVLGDELDLNEWENIKNTGNLPRYLADLEIEDEIRRQLRSSVPISNDSNLIQPVPQTENKIVSNTSESGSSTFSCTIVFSQNFIRKIF